MEATLARFIEKEASSPAGAGEAGGYFADPAAPRLSHAARWDGIEWQPLASGLTGPGDSGVRALLQFNDGSGAALFPGGGFRQTTVALFLFSTPVAKWYRPTPPCPPAP